jgi:hypothetical protein
MGYAEVISHKLPASIYGLLALRQHRLNHAVGILRVTPHIDILLSAYDKQRQREQAEDAAALAKIAGKSFYLGVIQGAIGRIKEIKAAVTIDTPIEEAQSLYREVLLLQEQIEKAQDVING